MREPVFEHAFEEAKVENLPPALQEAYFSEKEAQNILNSAFEYKLNKGLAKGRAEGLAKGLVKGRAEGRAEGRAKGLAEGRAKGRAEGASAAKLETARKMKAKGFSPADIAELTGLTLDQVQAL